MGTVQFGQDYGIANKNGKVPPSEVVEILDYARSVGINSLDTAFAYGESETVIGGYLREKPDRFKIVSKCPPLEQYRSGKAEEFLEQSFQRLGIKKLYGYLLHRSSDIFKYDDLWNELVRFKKKGKVEKIGFSLYSPDGLISLLDRGIDFDIVQVPYSIFDRRFEKYFDLLKRKGKEIQARSVFLQGLAFLELEDLPASLLTAKPQLKNLRLIARERNITHEAICLNFVLINRYIDKVIIGVDSLAQIKSNVASIDFMDNVREVYGQLSGIKIEQEDILLPYKWANAA